MYLSGGIQLLVVVCCIGHCKPYKYGIYWETFVTLFLSRGVNKIFQRMTKYFVRLLPFAFSTLSRFFFPRDQFYYLAGCLWQHDRSWESNLALFLFQ